MLGADEELQERGWSLKPLTGDRTKVTIGLQYHASGAQGQASGWGGRRWDAPESHRPASGQPGHVQEEHP